MSVGGFNDTVYDRDRVYIQIIQGNLELFKKDCGVYPSEQQGLLSLANKPKNLSCRKYKKYMNPPPDYLVYKSDGVTYEVVGDVNTYPNNIYIKGTDKYKAKFFKNNL